LNYVITWELDEKQKETKAPRAALAVKNHTLYAVIVYSATIPDLASVLRNMEVDYAINLDGGYTTALYYNGVYKEGPRRDFPNAVVFRKKR
jgi:exopolysaccharide biosynthesis protein